MKAFVLDASAALGWILDRPVPVRASHARDLVLAGAIAIVPPLWLQEVCNAVVMAQRRGRLTTSQAAALAADLEDFLHIIEVDSVPARPSALIQTAHQNCLTVYDATYLDLALRRRLPLATLDDKLAQAAKLQGLSLI